MSGLARCVAAGAAVVVAATALVLVEVVRAAPASAVAGAELVVAASDYDSQSSKSAVANCPTGTWLLGGGAQVVDGDGYVVPWNLEPTSTSYRVDAAEVVSYGGVWEVWAYAICGDALPVIQVQGGLIGNNVRELAVTVDCPAGTKVIAGGGRVIATNGSLQWIRPTDQGGFGRLVVTGVAEATGGMQVQGFAVCAVAPPGYQIVFTPTLPYTGRLLQVSAKCPNSAKVLGAGLTKANATGNAHVDGMFPTSDLKTVWVNSRQPYSSDPVNLAAWAICAS
jgi:hypothetical protein